MPYQIQNYFAPSIGAPGLSVFVEAGVVLVNGSGVAVPAQTISLPANSTSYVYLNTLTAGIVSNTSGFPTSTCYPIATAITGNSGVTSLTDSRVDVGGTGAGGSVTPINSLNNGKFISNGILNENMLGNAVTAVVSVSEQINFRQFILSVPMSIGECSQLITTASVVGGATNSYAIYSSTGNLLIDSGPFDSTLNTNTVQTNSFTNVILPVAVYIFAYVASDTALQVRGFPTTGFPNLISKNGTVAILGTASNVRNAITHAMPATLGTLTQAGIQNVPIAVWQF